MRCLSLYSSCSFPAPSPPSPFGKGSNAAKAGTPDAGPSGPAARLSMERSHAAVRSAPSRDRAEARFIGTCEENASFAPASQTSRSGRALAVAAGHRGPLQQFRKLHRKIDALADLSCALAVGRACAQLAEFAQQQFETLGHEPVAERRVLAR